MSNRRDPGDVDLVVENLATTPQQATTANDRAVMLVPRFWQRAQPFTDYVYRICNQFFEQLSARINETRTSLTGRVSGLSSQFFIWKDNIGRRISDINGRVRGNWLAICELRERMAKLENRLSQVEKKE